MGQAKQRGSFEERRSQSIERTEANELEKQREARAWWDSLAPDQQNAKLKERHNRTSGMRKSWLVPALLASSMLMVPIRKIR